MSTTNNNSKSILAKALATENIKVQYDPSAHTARFDIANRVLSMPILKENESECVTDMFIGHECAHALFSPYREKDTKSQGGWWMEAEEIGGTGNAQYVQDIMNIVEDVRIEKMMAEKFPGLRRDFASAYRELASRNFFATDGKNINDFSFIDRMNLHFKCGAFMNVQFSDSEQEIVDAVDKIRSFEDMIDTSRKVFEFVGGRKVNAPKMFENGASPSKNGKDEDESDAPNNGGGMTVEGDVDSNNDGNANQSDKTGTPSPTKDEGCVEDKNSSQSQGNNSKGGTGLAPDILLPPISTQRAFEENKKNVMDNKVVHFSDITLPTPDLTKIIFPIKKTHEVLSEYYNKMYIHNNTQNAKLVNAIKSSYADLVKSMNPLINTLIKQFEMKKAADMQKRTSVSRTGKIDCDRIFKYKVTDDIFSRFAKIAEGKNHGLVMYVDWSSSMQLATDDVITQIIMLTLFCRRMNIPFDVYLFTSQSMVFEHYGLHPRGNSSDPYSSSRVKRYKNLGSCKTIIHNGRVETGENDCPGDFALIHMLSSSMSKTQINEAMLNTYMLGKMTTGHGEEFRNTNAYRGVPSYFGQGNTPLDPTILCAMYMVPEFQAKHKVQIVNTIFLTDGESGYQYFHPTGTKNYSGSRYMTTVRSPINNKEYTPDEPTSTDTLLRMFREVTGSTTIGFFINGTSYCRYVQGDRKAMLKNIKDNGFIEAPSTAFEQTYDYATRTYVSTNKTMKNHGYDRLFILPCNVEIVDDLEELDNLDKNATLTRIRNTFMKSVEKRGSSRAFLNRFADVIANPSTR